MRRKGRLGYWREGREAVSVSPSLDRVVGPNLALRLIVPTDADYVYALRTDPDYNRHLSPVTGTAKDQRHWIETYKMREAEGREYYYVIERRDGTRCGLVRLYNIGVGDFAWGSWILDRHKPPKAALESAVLSFGIGFDILHLSTAYVDVRAENNHAIAFYRRFGMAQVDENDHDIFFIYPRERFEADRDRHLSLLSSTRLDG